MVKGADKTKYDINKEKNIIPPETGADDCVVIFDSASRVSRRKSQQLCSKIGGKVCCATQTEQSSPVKPKNPQNLSETFDDCQIVFEKYETWSDSISTNPAQGSELPESVFSEGAQQASDRQTMQIFACSGNSSNHNLNSDELTLDFRPSLLHELSYSTCLYQDKRKQLELLGIPIRLGKWSKKEDKILLRNWSKFVEEYQVDNPVLMLGLYRGKGQASKELLNFIKAKKFWFQLGKDLDDRPLSSIYYRAKCLLDMWRYKGKFSEKERQKLLILYDKFGNKWSKLALLMKRPAILCRNVCFYYKERCRKGFWTVQENDMLLRAVKQHVGSKKPLKFRGYPWSKIARDVPGRNEKQCRNHWLRSVCWKLKCVNPPKWTKKDSALLVYLMFSNMVEDECFTDWDFLYEKVKASVASYASLQGHWCKLKQKVPDWSSKDHESIVLYLYRNYLPKILAKLGISEYDLKNMI